MSCECGEIYIWVGLKNEGYATAHHHFAGFEGVWEIAERSSIFVLRYIYMKEIMRPP